MADRSETLTVRVTPRERSILEELAHRHGQSLSSYIRAAALQTAVADVQALESKSEEATR